MVCYVEIRIREAFVFSVPLIIYAYKDHYNQIKIILTNNNDSFIARLWLNKIRVIFAQFKDLWNIVFICKHENKLCLSLTKIRLHIEIYSFFWQTYTLFIELLSRAYQSEMDTKYSVFLFSLTLMWTNYMVIIDIISK